MIRNLSLWQLFGLTFVAVVGTLCHFLYDWTGIFAFAPFCAVNESTWEHMKILFFPAFLFAFIQRRAFSKARYFWGVKLIGISIAVTLIPVLFYTYNGAFGRSPDFVNILIFFLSAGAEFLIEYLLFKRNTPVRIPTWFALFGLTALATAFIVCTFIPPRLPLFQDPRTGGYSFV